VLLLGVGTGLDLPHLPVAASLCRPRPDRFAMLRRARPRAVGLRFTPLRGDVQRLPFRDASFDVACPAPDPRRGAGADFLPGRSGARIEARRDAAGVRQVSAPRRVRLEAPSESADAPCRDAPRRGFEDVLESRRRPRRDGQRSGAGLGLVPPDPAVQAYFLTTMGITRPRGFGM
jgi:hypothetical protein